MYVPKQFEVVDREVLAGFMAANSFAILVSTLDGAPFATHLPLLLDDKTSESGTLLGHVAAGNPHWRAFDGSQSLAIFSGPNGYVSPTWYAAGPAVPTWNYAAVHVYGRPQVVDDVVWLSGFVDRLTRIYDPEGAERELPAEFKQRMLKGIVGFRMEIERIEGKFKLSQNRPAEDIRRVIDHLEASTEPSAQALGAFSRRHLDADVSGSTSRGR